MVHLKQLSICLVLSFFFNFSIAQKANKNTSGYIQLNNVKHYYEIHGSGEPILLIHGNGKGITGWSKQIDYFSKKYRVYAIDNRGRGRSSLGTDSLSYIQMADDLAVFIAEMGIDSVSIVGKSDGGIIALLMGIYYPKRIKKIIAFSANLSPDTTAIYPEILNEIKLTRAESEKKLSKNDASYANKLVNARYRLMEFQPDISFSDLMKIQAPTLIISCDRDLIKLDHTFSIYNNIPNASLCILPLETHSVCNENATLFNTMVYKFLNEEFKDGASRFKK